MITNFRTAPLVAYWNQHPGEAPALNNATALLDEQYTGSHVFNLPATTSYSTLIEGVACEDPTATSATSTATSTGPSSSPAGTNPQARRWSVGFGDEQGVWPTQVDSDCAGLGGGLGSIKTAQFGSPTRVYVTVDDDTSYSLGVWGELAADTGATPRTGAPAPTPDHHS